MKKLLFILSLVLPINTNAATFIDTLGGECGRMLYKMNEYQHHDNIKLNKIQISKINELKTCLDLYTQYGGDFKELNIRYNTALALAKCHYEQYKKEIPPAEVLSSDDIATKLNAEHRTAFNTFIKQSPCLNYYLYKDALSMCSEITYLKTICELSTQNNENTIDTKK